MSSATVAVLFCDMVGSTELLVRVGDEVADGVRRDCFAALRRCVAEAGGIEVKNTGDGLMVVFPTSVVEAVACAVAMQQASRTPRLAPHVSLRVGVSVGEATAEEGDWFGTPVVEAARLCAAAEPGQVLVAEVVRLLVGTRGGFAFEPVGPLTLKGFEQPLPTCEVRWSTAAASEVPLPSVAATTERVALVGRAAELEQLRTAWKEATEGMQVCLLSGEPGVGKTRLVRELAREVHSQGGVVVWGRCDDEVGLAYQPFAEGLRALVTSCPQARLTELLGPLGGELSRLVPDLPALVPGLAEPMALSPELERHRLFEAVAELLARLGEEVPVLVVLDDVHWANAPTLALVRHLVRTGPAIHALVVTTYRDTDLDRSHPLSAALADIRREANVRRILLHGLDAAGVHAFIEALAGHDVVGEGEQLTAAVYAETDGNPFFVGEVLLHLAETGAVTQVDGRWVVARPLAEVGIPEGVRQVIGQRLSRLPEATQDVLSAASVLGHDFDVRLLAAVLDRPADEVADSLDPAEASGVIRPSPDSTGRYAFDHALVRSVLYDEMPTSRRLRLHRAAGRAMEHRLASRHDDHALAELAGHLCEAAALGEIGKAIEFSMRAAEAATGRLAFEEAAALYERAIGVLELADEENPGLRCDLEIAQGAALQRAGDPGYRPVLLAAADRARALGDGARLVAAASAFHSTSWLDELGYADSAVVRMTEDAIEALGTGDSSARARLLSSLAYTLAMTTDAERSVAVAGEAAAVAQRTGDHDAFVQARSILDLRRPHVTPAERLAEIDPVVDAAGSGPPEVAVVVMLARANVRLEAGDLVGAEADLGEAEVTAARIRNRFLQWQVAVARAVIGTLRDGPDEVERLSTEARELGQAAGAPSSRVDGVHLAQMTWVSWLRGDYTSPMPFLQAIADAQPGVPTWRLVLAYSAALGGDLPTTRRVLGSDRAALVEAIPRDWVWTTGLDNLAQIADRLDDADLASALATHAVQVGGRFIWNGAISPGPTDRFVGVTMSVLARYDDADAAFAAARDLCARSGARASDVLVQADWARSLLRRGGNDARSRADDMVGEARRAADALGMLGGFETRLGSGHGN